MASGIRSTQFAILVGIAKNQPLPIAALADMLVTDQTTLSRSLRLLQRQGLITISGRSTMRQRFLAITRKGERALQRTLPLWRKMHADFLSKIGSNQWHELRNELEKIARFAIDDAKKHPASAHSPRE
jgi:DNA-binding MarR family transcriptional regulator